MADTATRLRILASVEGIQGFNQLKASLQGLAQQGARTHTDLFKLNAAYEQLKRSGSDTISGMRLQVQALTQLRESVGQNTTLFRRYSTELDQVEAKLRSLARASRQAEASMARPASGGLMTSLATGAGIRGALGMQAGEAAMAGRLALAGGITAGLAAGTAGAAVVGGSVATAIDLAAEQRKVSTLTNDTTTLNKAIGDLVRTQNYMSSQAEATSAAYEILSSGFSRTEDVINILAASTKGAVGGFSDIRTVADATTSILNGYGRSAADAQQVIDMMIQTQNDGKIVVNEYAQGIGRLVPTAAAAGIGLEELNAGISALTAQGVPVDSTFAGLNQAIKSIIKPTDEARRMAAALGLDFSASALAAKGLGGFLADVTDKTKGNSLAMSILFSDIDGYKAVVGLTNDNLKRFNEFSDKQQKALNASAKAAEKAVDPFKQFSNANKDLGNSLGQLLLPSLTAVTEKMTQLVKLLMTTGLPDRLKQIMSVSSGFALPGAESLFGGIAPPVVKGGSALLNELLPPPPPPDDKSRDLPKPRVFSGQITPPSKTEDKKITDLAQSVLNAGAKKPSFEPSSKTKALINAAQRLGVSPLDIATIIGFETGGTYSPSIIGGEGNRYQGLIQMGPPERAQYGMNRSQSFEEQLQGPVVRFFQDRFKQVGMSTQGANLLQLYTTVLTGNPKGNIDSRDVFKTSPRSGVAAMGGHRQEALRRFFGGKIENVGYSMAEAGQNLAQGYEEQQKLAKQQQEELKTYKEKRAEQKAELDDLEELRQRNKQISEAQTEEEKIRAEWAMYYFNTYKDLTKDIADMVDPELARRRIEIVEGMMNDRKDADMRKIRQIYVDKQAERDSAAWADQQLSLNEILSQYYQQQADKLQEQNVYAESLSQTLGQGMQQAFSLAIQGADDLGAKLQELGATVLKDIAQQLIQISIIAPIVRSIAGIGGGGGITPIAPGISAAGGADFARFFGQAGVSAFAGGGGGLPGVNFAPIGTTGFGTTGFGFASGGIMTPQGPVPLRTYARGGIATAPQAAIYGEGSTPEAFVPLPDGRRIPVALRQYPGIPGTPGAPGGGFEQTDEVVRQMVVQARQESAAAATAAAASGGDGTMRIQLETTRINSIDYITAEQAAALANAAAARSTARQQRALQASPGARRGIGI